MGRGRRDADPKKGDVGGRVQKKTQQGRRAGALNLIFESRGYSSLPCHFRQLT
jgi:hypothetical protein